MSAGRLRLHVCEAIAPEAAAALAELQAGPVELQLLPLACLGPTGGCHGGCPGCGTASTARPAAAGADLATGTEPAGGQRPGPWQEHWLLCDAQAGCAARPGGTRHRFGNCLELFADPRLVRRWQAAGAYLLTPGWLQRWPAHLAAWGLDGPTARGLFAETASSLLLLDSREQEADARQLAALAETLALPAERWPVTPQGLRLLLSTLLRGAATPRPDAPLPAPPAPAPAASPAPAHQEPGYGLAPVRHRLADYEMMLDLLGTLPTLTTEQEVISRIFDCFTLLCGGRDLYFLPVVQGTTQPLAVCSPGGAEQPLQVAGRLARLARLSASHALSPDGAGFALRIAAGGETFGVLAIERVDRPELLRDHVNVALSSVATMALALANARHASQLRQANARLEEALRLRDLFTDILRHDLLQPASALGLKLAVMLRTNRDEQTRHSLLFLERNTARLVQMIRDAGMFARLESLAQLEQRELDLAQLLDQIVETCGPQLEHKHLTLRCRYAHPCWLTASPMVEEIFVNLLSNAMKYSPEGRPIELQLEASAGGVLGRVRDWGPGIADGDKPRLFLRFERADRSGVQGSGLGLAIVKRLVDLHRGRVWIEDNPEGGSVFSVWLPQPDGPGERAPAGVAPLPPASEPPAPPPNS